MGSGSRKAKVDGGTADASVRNRCLRKKRNGLVLTSIRIAARGEEKGAERSGVDSGKDREVRLRTADTRS